MRPGPRLLCVVVLAWIGSSALAASGIPVDGRVRDSGGVGLAGARVELRPILSRYEQGLRDLEGRPQEPAARAVTGADGRFDILAPGEGMWEVTVAADGFVPRLFRMIPLTAAESLPPVTLRRDAGLRVRVQAPGGRPLSGARVAGRPWREEADGWLVATRVATSGADGLARLPCSRDEVLWLFATAPGFPVQEGPETRGPAEIIFRLAAGTRRRIEAQIDGALVRDLRTSLVIGRTRGGRAEVAALSGDEPWLALETAEGVSVRFAVTNPVRPIEVSVPAPAPPLPGRVIDASTRQPIAGAWVWPQGDPARFVRTGADGGYLLAEARSSGLQAAAAGFLSEVADGLVPWPAGRLPAVALYPASIRAVTVEQEERRAVIGRIANADGSPVLDGEVEIRSGDVKLGPAGLGDGGLFAFADVPRGWYEILVRRPGTLAQRLPRFHVPESGGEADLGRLTLRAEDVLTGRLATPEGRPVAGAEVWAGSLAWMDPWEDPWPAAVSGPDGSFTLRASAWEWIQLTICRPGFLPAAQVLPQFFPDETLPLTLRPAAALAGRITGPDGSPIAGADAYENLRGDSAWVPGCDGADWRTSDGAGRFRIDSLEPGFYDIGRELVTLAAGETRDAVIRYEGGGPSQTVLLGRLLDEDGLPVPGARISLEVREEKGTYYTTQTVSARSDGDGNYRLEFSKPEVKIGSYGVSRDERSFTWAGLTPWPGPEILRGEVSYDLKVKGFREARLQPAADVPPTARPAEPDEVATLTGRIVGLAAEDLSRVALMAGRTGWGAVAGSVEARGTYRFDGLEPGQWWVRVAVDGNRHLETVHIPGGEPRIDRDLVLGPLTEVKGVVETQDNESIAGANVSFHHLARPYQIHLPVAEARTRSDGTFSIRLPRGEYAASASRDGFLSPAWSVPGIAATVGEGAARYVRVHLDRTARLSGPLLGLPAEEDVKIEATRLDQEGYQIPLTGKMDTEGTYSILGLGPGLWNVAASYDRLGGEKRKATGRIEIPEDAAEASLGLDFHAGGLTLAGRVPAAGDSYIWVDLLRPDGGLVVEEARVLQDAFRIGNLRAGTYLVRLMSFDGREDEVLAEREVVLPLSEELVIEVPVEE